MPCPGETPGEPGTGGIGVLGSSPHHPLQAAPMAGTGGPWNGPSLVTQDQGDLIPTPSSAVAVTSLLFSFCVFHRLSVCRHLTFSPDTLPGQAPGWAPGLRGWPVSHR